ncbi:PRC-barrel domain-containing protein [Mangrovicoccus ximenensis]|uniref:PRC-barrel domain-containing protein n=1 Tax=Mangrovicoccus ximenensis TaxID=1911570 RepID=UPI00137528D4|nr:PRC-barrel domain-containing protein [Mangrovicoccus ximenensis]
MTKFTVASTALALVLAAPLSAQTADEMSGFAYNPTGEEVRASNFIGARVYTPEAADEADAAAEMPVDGTGTEDRAADQVAAEVGTPADPRENYDDVGEIGDVLMSRDGEIEAILVDVGGFLGIGEKQVAISMDKLQFMPGGEEADDWFVVFESSRETLENAPVYEDPELRAGLDAADANVAAVPEAADGTTAVVPESRDLSETEAAEWTEEKAAQGEAALDEAGDKTAAAMESAEQGLENAAEATGEAAQDAGNAVAGAVAAAGEEMQEAGQNMAAATDPQEGYVTADVGDVTTDQLTGARVYDLNDKRIGEVHEVSMSTDGQVDKAIVDVGGFLGLGEKRVELGFDKMNIEKLEGGDELRIQVNATKDELMEMPEYEG